MVTSAVRRSTRRLCGAALVLLTALTPALAVPALAQEAGERTLAASESPISLDAARRLLAQGDAAAASGNLTEARRLYDLARDYCRRLLGFYRDLSGSFRGLDARIPREMDQKGRQALELMAQTNLRLAALFRRQNQPEVAVPLLVEVVKVMTPATEEGRKAYQMLVEIGFATTPYTAGQAASAR
jgi:hypothetical protein